MRKLKYILISALLFIAIIFVVACNNSEPKGTQVEITGFELIDNESYGKVYYNCVPNSKIIYSFSDIVNISAKSNWSLSTDIYGNNTITSKTVSLNEGDNIYYLLVQEENGNSQQYTIIIRRRPIYRVEYMLDENTVFSTENIEEGEYANPPTLNKEGYTFLEWSTDIFLPITDNITAIAIWGANKYSIAYNVNGGRMDSEQDKVVDFHSLYKLEIPYYAGHTFKGWYYNNEAITDANGESISEWDYTQNITVTAHWQVNTYSIILNKSNVSAGSVYGSGSYVYGDNVTITATPYKGYSFDGWYCNNNFVSNKKEYSFIIEDEKTYVAKFNQLAEMEGFLFSSTVDTCTITGITDELATQITIPSIATSIGQNAFKDCTNLVKIYIPDSISFVENLAISNCINLQYNIYNNAKYLGNKDNPYLVLIDVISTDITTCEIHPKTKILCPYSFTKCTKLTSISIPESVICIGDSVFRDCTNLTNISIPNSIVTMGETVFYNCDKLNYNIYEDIKYLGNDNNPYVALMEVKDKKKTSYNIHKDIKTIAPLAFSYCYSLTNISIPNGITEIGYGTFLYCTSLSNVDIPNSVTKIGRTAFSECNSLSSIKIPDTVTVINQWAFNKCSSLTSIEIPYGVTSIGNFTFAYCTNLKNISIPNSVTEIGNCAFIYCENLTNINIPESIKTIGSQAFSDCYKLETAVISINSPLESIGENAFADCINLTEIIIPDSVNFIGYFAFVNCKNLTIYAEMQSEPNTWEDNWNLTNRPVVWGYSE